MNLHDLSERSASSGASTRWSYGTSDSSGSSSALRSRSMSTMRDSIICEIASRSMGDPGVIKG